MFIFQDHTQHYKDFVFRAFDPVVIRLSLDTTNVQREKIVFELVKPYIPGFSVEPMDIESATDEQPSSSTKRKSIETATTIDDETKENSTSKMRMKKNKKSKK